MAKLFYFCHFKKLVRPETFGPYYVLQAVVQLGDLVLLFAVFFVTGLKNQKGLLSLANNNNIIIIFIYCNWADARWQWLYTYSSGMYDFYRYAMYQFEWPYLF